MHPGSLSTSARVDRRSTIASVVAREAGQSPGAYPEIDCVRPLLADAAAVEDRAERVGVGADQVLIAGGLIDEDDYLHRLADALGTRFEPLDDVPRAQCPLDDDKLIGAAAVGMLPLAGDAGIEIVVAPRGIAVRRIATLAAGDPDWPKRFRFTSTKRLDRYVLRCAGDALVEHACERLRRTRPSFSAAACYGRGRYAPLAALAALALAAALAPVVTAAVIEFALATLFLAWLGLRLSGALIAPTPPAPPATAVDADLPVYTVIAALYREAACVPDLLRAIARLDYPVEKLDVILAVEADDHATRNAIERCQTRLPVRVVPVPKAEPRTKPKALNAALPFARGHFTVIYDAEDRPEPDQLKRAVQAFHGSDPDLACLQARLCIDNTADSWLTRLFTAEYAAQFDIFLDALTRLSLPLPLGGSSNHFVTAALREVGGWDPYNVTEDADLGMRLARCGYRAAMIDSTTYEEAPARLMPWLRQRTRWFKGWMQTWTVHIREPRRLVRELGPAGFLAFQLVVGGNVLSALIHPLFLAGLVFTAMHGFAPNTDGNVADVMLTVFCATSAVVGYAASGLLGWLGLKRRGLTGTAWILLLTPLNWLLLSLAAWRALYQLATAPYAWEKTEHGLARTSRRADLRAQALVELEGYLRQLKDAGEIAQTSDDATSKRPLDAKRRRSDPSDPPRAGIAAAGRPGLASRLSRVRPRARVLNV